jgi:hypothetical protein
VYVSRIFRKNPIVIPQADHHDLDTCFHMGFIRFTPPLSD